MILIGWFIKLSVQIFQPLIVIYRKGNFDYHHWGYTLIYQPLSYPCRSILGGRGHWTINYSGTQSFITRLSYLLALKV